MQYKSSKPAIGGLVLLFVLIISLIIYLSIQKYEAFFIPLIFGLISIIFHYLYNISKFYTLKNQLINPPPINNPKVNTCPEYWKKIINKDNIECNSKNIFDNTSFANIVETSTIEGGETFNILKYKNLSLNDINLLTSTDSQCEKMFNSYYMNDQSKTDTLKNKKDITWVEYQNKCVKDV